MRSRNCSDSTRRIGTRIGSLKNAATSGAVVIRMTVPPRTIGQKVRESLLAVKLESEQTKDQILALYLNVIYLGNGVYGVEAASRDLFGKNVEDVTIAEGAMLAALPAATASAAAAISATSSENDRSAGDRISAA